MQMLTYVVLAIVAILVLAGVIKLIKEIFRAFGRLIFAIVKLGIAAVVLYFVVQYVMQFLPVII